MEDDLIPLDIIDDFLNEHVTQSNLLQTEDALFDPNVDQNTENSSNIAPALSFRPSYPVLERVQQQKPQEPQEDEDDDNDDEGEADQSDNPSATATKQVKQRKPYGSKKKKDPNAPTAAISAYTFFFRETQPTIKSQNPGLKFGDLSRKVAAMWESMPETEKAVFRKRSEEDRARFNRETEEYKSSQASTAPPQQTQQQPQTVKIVFLGRNNEESPLKSSPQKEEEHCLFSTNGNQESLSNLQPPVWDVTGNKCLLEGCTQFAVKSPEWEDEFCSNECAVKHCKKVFSDFVLERSMETVCN